LSRKRGVFTTDCYSQSYDTFDFFPGRCVQLAVHSGGEVADSGVSRLFYNLYPFRQPSVLFSQLLQLGRQLAPFRRERVDAVVKHLCLSWVKVALKRNNTNEQIKSVILLSEGFEQQCDCSFPFFSRTKLCLFPYFSRHRVGNCDLRVLYNISVIVIIISIILLFQTHLCEQKHYNCSLN